MYAQLQVIAGFTVRKELHRSPRDQRLPFESNRPRLDMHLPENEVGSTCMRATLREKMVRGKGHCNRSDRKVIGCHRQKGPSVRQTKCWRGTEVSHFLPSQIFDLFPLLWHCERLLLPDGQKRFVPDLANAFHPEQERILRENICIRVSTRSCVPSNMIPERFWNSSLRSFNFLTDSEDLPNEPRTQQTESSPNPAPF
jgi:hypothetical protein